MKSQKMLRTARNLDTLVRVGGGIARAAAIVCGIFAVLVLVLGEKMYQIGSLSVDLDFITLYLAEEYQTVTQPLILYTIVGLLIAAVLCVVIWRASVVLRRILAPMKEGRPFESDTPANLRKIAWLTLIGGALTQIAGIAERMILTKAFFIEELLSSPAISGIEYNYTLDLNFVLISCVILFLSYIFSYGQQLQQEADETL